MIGILTCAIALFGGQDVYPEATVERMRKMGLEVTFRPHVPSLGGKGIVRRKGRVYDYSVSTGCCKYAPVIDLHRTYQMAKPINVKVLERWMDQPEWKSISITPMIDHTVTFRTRLDGFEEAKFNEALATFEKANRRFELFLGRVYYHIELENGASERPRNPRVKIDPIPEDLKVTEIVAEEIQSLAKQWGWKPLGIIDKGFSESLVEVNGTPVTVLPGSTVGVIVFLRDPAPTPEQIKQASVFAQHEGTSRGLTAMARMELKDGFSLREFRLRVETIAKGMRPWAAAHPDLGK